MTPNEQTTRDAANDIPRPLSPSEVVWEDGDATWNGIDLRVVPRDRLDGGRPGEHVYTVNVRFVDAGTAPNEAVAKAMAMRKAVALYELMLKGVAV